MKREHINCREIIKGAGERRERQINDPDLLMLCQDFGNLCLHLQIFRTWSRDAKQASEAQKKTEGWVYYRNKHIGEMCMRLFEFCYDNEFYLSFHEAYDYAQKQAEITDWCDKSANFLGALSQLQMGIVNNVGEKRAGGRYLTQRVLNSIAAIAQFFGIQLYDDCIQEYFKA